MRAAPRSRAFIAAALIGLTMVVGCAPASGESTLAIQNDSDVNFMIAMDFTGAPSVTFVLGAGEVRELSLGQAQTPITVRRFASEHGGRVLSESRYTWRELAEADYRIAVD